MENQSSKSIRDLSVYLFLLIAGTVLLFPILSKEASFCITPDNLHQAYPFFNKLTTSLYKGYLPLWDANTYSGKNFAGEFQTGIFYPLNILWCLIFGSAKGIDVYYLDLLMVLHYFICLFGMYRLSRTFRLQPVASITAAMVFTFTGIISARANAQTCIFTGLVWMPWAILFTCKFYLHQKRRRYLVFSGLIAGIQILAGHVQPFFHTLMICGIMILFYEYQHRKDWTTFLKNVVLYTLIITLTAILISLPQDYYAAQYLSRAYRWVGGDAPIRPGEKVPFHIYAYKFIIRPQDISNFLGRSYSSPDDSNLLYTGILPLMLTIVFFVKKNTLQMAPEHLRLKKLLSIVLGAGILSTLGYVTLFCIVLYEIPFVNSVRELGRYGVLINFSFALFAGLAVNYLTEIQQALTKNFRTLKFWVLLLLTLNAGYLAFFEKQHILPQTVIIPVLLSLLFFSFLFRIQNGAILRVLVICVLFADLFLNRVDYAGIQSGYYPSNYYSSNSIFRFLETTYGKYRVAFDMQNDDQRRRNLGDVYNIQLKLGYCATMNMSYFDFIASDWAQNSEVNDLLNVRYIMTDKLLDSSFVFKDSAAGLHLYERKNYYPRIYWKSQLGKKGPEIEEENKDNIKQTVYSDLYQKIEIDCPKSDTLIVSENFYPGWKCYDNGRKVDILRASIKNYPSIFRSVSLEKGHHTIEFRYAQLFYWSRQ